MMSLRSAMGSLAVTLAWAATTFGQEGLSPLLDRTLVVMEAELRQVYLIGPGERFRLLGKAGAKGLNSLELAPDGNLYSISGTQQKLHRLDPRTGISSLIGSIGYSTLGELAIGQDGTAWTSSGSNVLSIDLATGQLLSNAGTGPLQLVAWSWRAPGELVGLDTRGGNHLSFVETNGNVYFLAPVFALIGKNGGMAIDGSVGFFATGGLRGGGGHKLFRFDPFTGEQIYLAPLPARFAEFGTLGVALLPDRKRGRPLVGPKGPITR